MQLYIKKKSLEVYLNDYYTLNLLYEEKKNQINRTMNKKIL